MLKQAETERYTTSSWQKPELITLSTRVVKSYEHWLKEPLLPGCAPDDPYAMAKALFEAPFPILVHTVQPDPVLSYANQQALMLWRGSWEEIVGMHSRNTADPAPYAQEQRDNLLNHVKREGFVKGFSGRRISRRGERFEILDSVSWNVTDEFGARFGQALRVSNWWYV